MPRQMSPILTPLRSGERLRTNESQIRLSALCASGSPRCPTLLGSRMLVPVVLSTAPMSVPLEWTPGTFETVPHGGILHSPLASVPWRPPSTLLAQALPSPPRGSGSSSRCSRASTSTRSPSRCSPGRSNPSRPCSTLECRAQHARTSLSSWSLTSSSLYTGIWRRQPQTLRSQRRRCSLSSGRRVPSPQSRPSRNQCSPVHGTGSSASPTVTRSCGAARRSQHRSGSSRHRSPLCTSTCCPSNQRGCRSCIQSTSSSSPHSTPSTSTTGESSLNCSITFDQFLCLNPIEGLFVGNAFFCFWRQKTEWKTVCQDSKAS